MHLVDFHTLSLKDSHNIDKGNNEKYENCYFVNKKYVNGIILLQEV